MHRVAGNRASHSRGLGPERDGAGSVGAGSGGCRSPRTRVQHERAASRAPARSGRRTAMENEAWPPVTDSGRSGEEVAGAAKSDAAGRRGRGWRPTLEAMAALGRRRRGPRAAVARAGGGPPGPGRAGGGEAAKWARGATWPQLSGCGRLRCRRVDLPLVEVRWPMAWKCPGGGKFCPAARGAGLGFDLRGNSRGTHIYR